MQEEAYSAILLWCLAATLVGGAAFALVYGMQRQYVLHRMAGLARQSRHLYRALQAEMQDIEALRLAQHDAQNELVVLQGFLERGRPQEAAAYLDELLQREQQRPNGP